MTTQERIDAAIAARDKATPEPLEVVFKGTIGKYAVEKQDGGVHKQLAYCGYSDALLFAAAPDLAAEVVRLRKAIIEYEMALASEGALILNHEGHIAKLDAQIERLRKWQSEAVQYLDDALEYHRNQISVWEVYNRHKVYQSALDDINRLIAEAEEEHNVDVSWND